jgi:hypothetical protein
MTPYADDTFALEFFGTRMNSEAWDDATSTERTKALGTATRAIDRLSYISQKTDEDQEQEWPRGGDTEVPDDIKIATCEEALSLLEGRDPIMEEESLRNLSHTYANVKTSYDPNTRIVHILNGITSPIAWRYLTTYLRNRTVVDIQRT